jgi:UDP-glucuronate 4-epimerase
VTKSTGQKILVTGAAGFIGFHLTRRLLGDGHSVLGVDNFNSYYIPKLKRDRIAQIKKDFPSTEILELDIKNPELENVVKNFAPEVVVHLAAQAGVRYSLENPWAYIDSNVAGFQRILESVRASKPLHFIFASSSSVYGSNKKMPYSVDDRVDNPVSIYGATKRSNELMGKVYADLFGIPTTGLRFFTVYGSWGRPDMAYFSFTEKILKGESIPVFNNGNLKRDFTHVSDIVESIVRLKDHAPRGDNFRLLNIGASQPTQLMEFISTLEGVIGKKAKLEYKPHQPGDVLETYADVSALEKLTKYQPHVGLREGLIEFFNWYKSYNHLD